MGKLAAGESQITLRVGYHNPVHVLSLVRSIQGCWERALLWVTWVFGVWNEKREMEIPLVSEVDSSLG